MTCIPKSLAAGAAAALLLVLALDARAADGRLKPMAGSWSLVSIYEEDTQGLDLNRWGTRPEGRLTVGGDGTFSLLLVGRDIVQIAANNAERTCAGLKACREVMEQKVLGYAGKLRAGPDDAVLLDISDELERGWKNSPVKTSVRIEGERMHFTTAVDPSPTGAFYVHMVWQRK